MFNQYIPLIAKVLNDQNLFTKSNLVSWFSSYVQFCSGGHFSKRAEAALQCGKMNHLNTKFPLLSAVFIQGGVHQIIYGILH